MIGGITYAPVAPMGVTKNNPAFTDIFGRMMYLDDLDVLFHAPISSNEIITNEYIPEYDFDPKAKEPILIDWSKVAHPSGQPKSLGSMTQNDLSGVFDDIPYADVNGFISSDDLFSALGTAFPKKAQANYNVFVNVFKKYGSSLGLKDDKAFCYFLAQLAHESGNFKATVEDFNRYTAANVKKLWGSKFSSMEEIKSYIGKPYELAEKVYGGRMGNDQPGDGYKYRGRGFIQLTGKGNYRVVSKYLKSLGVEKWDIVTHPEWVSDDPEIGALAAIGYMLNRDGAVAAANAHDVKTLTKKINGGYNGLAARTELTNSMLTILDNYNKARNNSSVV